MALTSNKADKKTTKEIMFHTGVIPLKVMLYNPNEKELATIGVNYDPGEYVKDDNFNEGHKQYLMSFWLQNMEYVVSKNGENIIVPEGEVTIPFMINIGDTPLRSKDGSKGMYVNAYGDTVYLADPENVYDWFDAKDLREAHNGEQTLYEFLRAYANIEYTKDFKEDNCLGDPKQLFEDDSFFKDYMKSLINDKPTHVLYMHQSLKYGGENENGQHKVKEILYKQYFQKKTQANSAISNFKSYINATRVKEEKKNDALLNREPKGEFWTIEPAIYTLDEAVIKVRSSSDNDSDKDSDYQQSSATF